MASNMPPRGRGGTRRGQSSPPGGRPRTTPTSSTSSRLADATCSRQGSPDAADGSRSASTSTTRDRYSSTTPGLIRDAVARSRSQSRNSDVSLSFEAPPGILGDPPQTPAGMSVDDDDDDIYSPDANPPPAPPPPAWMSSIQTGTNALGDIARFFEAFNPSDIPPSIVDEQAKEFGETLQALLHTLATSNWAPHLRTASPQEDPEPTVRIPLAAPAPPPPQPPSAPMAPSGVVSVFTAPPLPPRGRRNPAPRRTVPQAEVDHPMDGNDRPPRPSGQGQHDAQATFGPFGLSAAAQYPSRPVPARRSHWWSQRASFKPA